jgi:endonuclease/exonuclease/phosphatase family metal-dependent hydrolase
MKNTVRYGIAAWGILLLLWGCSLTGPETDASRTGNLVIASWNVQALFDGGDNGFEYDEYKNDAGWTDEKYRARLIGIAGAIKGANGDEGLNPDILALIEVENPAVLRDLAELPGMDYRWTFFASLPGGALGIGILSRFPFTETRAHSASFPGGSTPRPVAEVWVDCASGPLVIMACHWKSKLGGAGETEVLRRAEAGIIARRLEEINAASPGTPVIVLGDLNENYDEYSRIGGAYPCALLPDKEAAAEGVKAATHPRPGFQDFLVISAEKPPRNNCFTNINEAAVLYSPWEDSPLKGSYYYNDEWETIDQFLLNDAFFDQQGWEFEGFWVPEAPPFTSANAVPHGYNPRTGNGLSDHLPIVLGIAQAPL